MGLDTFSKYFFTLKRSKGNLVVKSLGKDDDMPETTEKFQLSSLFTLLEDGELRNSQPSLCKITSLDLSYCDLFELPKALKFLNLKNLNLSHNKFTMVPLCLYGNGLNTLESLDISYNLITHFDVEPDCVFSLKVLCLNNNSFKNIPPWFLTFRCTSLEELCYDENKAQHYNFLNHSCNFSIMKLRKLELRNTCLVDADLLWLKCFKNLQLLDISNKPNLRDRKCINKFKELDQLFAKPRWKEMKILKLSYLDISFFPEGIFWIESLTELCISNNLLSWFPDGIEFLVNLEFLDVSCNELVVMPKQICKLLKLKALIAWENHLDEIPILPKHLEVLDLYDNYIQTIEIANFDRIMFIDLDCNFACLTEDLNLKYGEYCLKRDQFREMYNVQDRSCSSKILEEFDENSWQSKSSGDSDYEYSENDVTKNVDNFKVCIPENLEEDWDKECENSDVCKHPDITLSDNDYDGESQPNLNKSFNRQACLYVDEEDWIFVDAD